MWTTPGERNSLAAIATSFEHGFGVETDVRDCAGRLVISHDPPSGGEAPLGRLFDAWHPDAGPLALNVKADGLQAPIAAALADAGDPEYFVFDMSIPDALGYRRAGLRYFTRQSEYEPVPALYETAAGVWLDCFESAWFDRDLVAEHLGSDKQVCIVSPELHGRDQGPAWERWSTWDVLSSPDVLLCTDLPLQAGEAFA